ncbi:MAG: HpcH/HpaI aldolase family protein [bacterium]
MLTNKAKAQLKGGGTIFGCVVPGKWPQLVEICGFMGFDFAQIDMEHGPLTMSECAELIRAAEISDATPLVRIPRIEPDIIMRVLDMGAQGVIVPHLSSRAEAEAVVRAAYYGPIGERGCGEMRASGWGTRMSLAEYVAYANRETMIVGIVESKRGVESLDEILSVPQIDVINIGPYDLANSMGYPCQIEQPEVQAAITVAMERILASDKVLGLGARTAEAVFAQQRRGARYILNQATALFTAGIAAFPLLARARAT